MSQRLPVRFLRIEGDICGVYSGRTLLAVFAGASELDVKAAEQLRTAPAAVLNSAPIEKKQGE